MRVGGMVHRRWGGAYRAAELRHIAMHGHYVLSKLGIARGEHRDDGGAVIEAAVVLDERTSG